MFVYCIIYMVGTAMRTNMPQFISFFHAECFTNNTVNDEEYTSQCTFCSYFVSLVEDAPSSSSVDPCAKKKMIFGRKFWGKLKKNISKRRFTGNGILYGFFLKPQLHVSSDYEYSNHIREKSPIIISLNSSIFF